MNWNLLLREKVSLIMLIKPFFSAFTVFWEIHVSNEKMNLFGFPPIIFFECHILEKKLLQKTKRVGFEKNEVEYGDKSIFIATLAFLGPSDLR